MLDLFGTPVREDVEILVGDCREVLRGLPAGSVHCCVTSPPYFGLRDYKTGTWDGGDAWCEHLPVTGMQGGNGQRADREHTAAKPQKATCSRCGATRVDRQIGLEQTPDAYVAALVAVFREVRRVLRDDGTLWLNLGDSYAGSWGNQGRKEGRGTQRPVNGPMIQNLQSYPDKKSNTGRIPEDSGLKPKDLIGIPWRVAFALQADGWYLRSDIIWAKGNPMPESVTDRPTSAHEHVFLLTKSPKYYFDAEAVAESSQGAHSHGKNATSVPSRNDQGADLARIWGGATRNIRNVWHINPKPYRGAHFATFPPALVEPCVKAGSPAGGLVLDPFGGSGTVGLVARQLGRRAVLVELNPDYAAMARERVDSAVLVRGAVEPADRGRARLGRDGQAVQADDGDEGDGEDESLHGVCSFDWERDPASPT